VIDIDERIAHDHTPGGQHERVDRQDLDLELSGFGAEVASRMEDIPEAGFRQLHRGARPA
jgi:hypothetical protein